MRASGVDIRSARHCLRSNSTYGLGSLSRDMVSVLQGRVRGLMAGLAKCGAGRLRVGAEGRGYPLGLAGHWGQGAVFRWNSAVAL
ncbi:Uncharacterised protein [Mycobacterium tuberculosis]|nr:Uncharacterised protein [Mycobacterium tuberculosis]CPA50947.1 Uncharacterised protein [Mycobacterium tuberculosis]SIP68100.1 hypothetical protein BN9982_90069 [Mycobacterium tuberculosis]